MSKAPRSFTCKSIEIPDDEVTASSAGSDGEIVPLPAAERCIAQKVDADADAEAEAEAEEDKVAWTEDSEDDAYTASKKRKGGGKRKCASGGQKKKTGPEPKKKKRRATGIDSKGRHGRDASRDEEHVNPGIPDYLYKRKRNFEKTREELQDAGLRLPPDFADVEFSDDERVGSLEERPRFDGSSGIRPSRAYKDVELPFSAGLVPASIAQYLREYQLAGVSFLHQLFVYQRGGILGDDMGLGKTVQVAAFLTAAFGKTGDERDGKRMRKMRRAPGDPWYPRVLIVCPGSLIQNWRNELARWGWWHTDTYHGLGKEDVLQTARAGRLECMITTYVTYKNNRGAINAVQWDAVVADECHVLKERASQVTQAMNEVNALCRIGLTGTAIQNKYEELWTLLNWTNPGNFGTIAEWRQTISKPLTVGQSHDATLHQLSLARKTAKKLVQNLLPPFFLRRMKTLIADQLPTKRDRVVFCPLTDIQKGAYENFLDSDQVALLRTLSEPCPCGSTRKKGWCCSQTLDNGKSWQTVVFPSVMALQKLSNHLTLLIPASSDKEEKQRSELRTLQLCMPDQWESLYKKRDSLLSLANPEFCGKWKILKKLLKFWHGNGDKVLVFSHSVRLLRIFQHLFHNTSYSVSYLDGSLSYEDRQKAVDDFNSDPGQFVFLISTKAGGVGLNITSANKVVIVDPHWNPSYDLQAQDRAFRLGQVRDVDVFRLISSGTIEEIVYARQIYKQQQANIGYNASSERRYFKGVQQDADRKGELFGLSNLFSFHGDETLLREVINQTNIAEAKAGVNLSDIDMEKVAKDPEDELAAVEQQEDAEPEDGGLGQLAELFIAKTGSAEGKGEAKPALRSRPRPRSDAIQAILTSAGVEYTHDNSEVVGSSRIEAQLSRRAELAGFDDAVNAVNAATAAAASAAAAAAAADPAPLQGDDQANHVPDGAFRFRYNPPAGVMRRQLCSMAREFGFAGATEFALVVENWTQEQRRNCLDTFYKRREARLLAPTPAAAGFEKGEKDEKKMEGAARGGGEGQLEDVPARAHVDDKGCLVRVEGGTERDVVGGKRAGSIFVYDDDDEDDEETDEL